MARSAADQVTGGSSRTADPARPLEGASALVTGAASGIGRAMALAFSRAGARVGLIDRDGGGLAALAGEIADAGGRAFPQVVDIAEADAVAEAVQATAGRFGGLDVVVNHAGISAMAAIDTDGYPAVWDRHLAVLLTAQMHVIRAALPFLRASAHPRILNIASTEALGATAGLSAYSAAKAGVVGLTRSLAVELGPEGITANCICPGPILTGMTEAIPDEAKATYAHRRTALRRYGRPDEIAHMALNLCVPAASYVTGAVIPVDGGLSARYG